jgi:hypothetical protein
LGSGPVTGYNTVLFDTPVALSAGQTFVVSYNNNTDVTITEVAVTAPRSVLFGTYVINTLNVTPGAYPASAGANREYFIMPILA